LSPSGIAALERLACTAYFDDRGVELVARRSSAAVGMPLIEKQIQLEIFPEKRHVDAVDPRLAIGPDTRVEELFHVRYGDARQVHQIYHDRHGWYCAEHGPRCGAVTDAVDAAGGR
jgi:hypothetical protein